MGFFLYLLALIWHIFFCFRFQKEIIEKINHKMRLRAFILIAVGLIILTDIIYLIFFVLISYIKIFFSIDAIDQMMYSSPEFVKTALQFIGSFSVISLLTACYAYYYLRQKYLL